MKNKGIYIIANPLLFWGCPFFIITVCLLPLMQFLPSDKPLSLAGHLLITILFGGFAACSVYEIIKFMPVSNMVLKLTDDGIVCIRPFRKKEKREYKKIHVYCSRYFEGTPLGIGGWKYFIILSKSRFSTKELNNPQDIKVDADTIKIAFSKRRLRKLESVLPEYLTNQIKNMLMQAGCRIK